MKYKILAFILITLFLFGFFMNIYINTDNNFANIKNKIIRLHIVANSDSLSDQQIKLRVRDAVMKEMKPTFKGITDTEKAKTVIRDNLESIKTIAEKELENLGKSFPVEVELKKCEFPNVKYGELLFPQGEYQALNIRIGNGKGKNWWCVMFPPLCFTEMTQEVVFGEKELSEILTTEEIEFIKNGVEEKIPIKIKFKVAEIYKSFNEKIAKLIRKNTEISK